jgi:hypothetical protein
MAIQTKVKKSVGTSGLAEVRVLKNGLRVIFADGDTYEVSSEGWNYPTGKYQITLSEGNDKILFASPPAGTYLVRFREFGNRQNKSDGNTGMAEPYIKRGGMRDGKNGNKWFAPDELSVSCKLEVVDPSGPSSAYKGLNIIYSFPYAFDVQPGTQFTMITAKASRLVKIEEFLRIAGLDFLNDDIPYSTNVLPWLEHRLQSARKRFSVTLNEKGFVQTLTEIPDYLLPADEDVPTNGKAKTKRVKATA